MLNTVPILWIKLIPALLIGFLVARRLRNTVLSIVFRMLPIKYRMSDNGFHKHTRLSTLIGISLVLGVSGLLFYLFSGIQAKVLPDRQEVIHISNDTHTPTTNPIRISSNTAYTPLVENDSKSLFTSDNNRKDIGIQYENEEKHNPKPILETQYYLQLAAFTTLKNAQKRQQKWSGKMTFDCWIASSTDGMTPYKVLLGPFPSRAQANHIRKRYDGLKDSYVKHGVDLTFFQQAN